jgi:hypothetical protein
MIAYNICFSTCLGRVEKFKGTDKFGFTELKVADGLLELLKDYLTGESAPGLQSLVGSSGCSHAKRYDIRQTCCEKEPVGENVG